MDMKLVHEQEWFFDFTGIMGSTRKITGTFHVPEIDKDNELITAEAMDDAMDDYMHFPTIAEYHKERPFAIVTKAWKTHDGEYALEGLVKMTADCDDIWAKVQTGQYNMMSIAGKRTEASAECSLHPVMRGQSRPCITKGLRLDSISACDEGARNPLTSLGEVQDMVKAGEELPDPYLYTSVFVLTKVKDTLIKATGTDSSLIHTVADGALKRSCKLTKKCSGGKSPELEKSAEVSESEEKKEEVVEEKDEEKKAEPTPEVKKEQEAEKKDEEKKAEDPYQEILTLLRQLVASDKKVHAEVGKADEPEEKEKEKKMEKSLTDGKPGQETPEEVGDQRSVTKATVPAVDPAEFAKAMSTISALQAKIEALEGMAVQKAVVVIQDSTKAGDVIESDADVIIKANGGKVR